MPLNWWELMLILLVILLVFGAKRLPEMGRSMGKGMREFKDAVTGLDDKTPSSTTASAGTPTGATSPGELPAAPSEAGTPESGAGADEKERETVS
jgi:TatA/E family protein of Tat protein translocase